MPKECCCLVCLFCSVRGRQLSSNAAIQSFFQTKKIFFQEQKNFFQGTTFIQFFMYCKAKKNFGVIRKFLKIFDFPKSLSKLGPNVEDFNSS